MILLMISAGFKASFCSFPVAKIDLRLYEGGRCFPRVLMCVCVSFFVCPFVFLPLIWTLLIVDLYFVRLCFLINIMFCVCVCDFPEALTSLMSKAKTTSSVCVCTDLLVMLHD